MNCRRCARPVTAVDPTLFEGMHWLCFHLEFAHDTDPDLPCADPSCPHVRIAEYERRLRELGVKL